MVNTRPSMPSTDRLKTFRTIAILAALCAYGVAVLGSWVRINGAGMTCPDWPLCNGALIPSLQGGVILEWLHRLLVLVLSILIIAIAVFGWRVRRIVAGVQPMLVLLGAAFVLQVGLGGVTIFQANSPPSVTMHWGAAMLLLAAFTALAVLGIMAPQPGQDSASEYALAPLAFALVMALATMLLGAYVSSSGAGLACHDVPLCGGSAFGSTSAQVLQMFHRIAAFAVLIAAIYAFMAVGVTQVLVRRFTGIALALVVLQIVLGLANVIWSLPTALREAHAANAALVFIVYIIALTLSRVEAATTEAYASGRISRAARAL